ncbi:MAG: hypothetical protein AB7L66_05720 [Gemmatimonadales bacterium]
MITADARSRLTAGDLDLLAHAVGGAPGDHELIRTGLDAILDRAEVRRTLLGGPIPGPSPSLFFYVLVRQSLLEQEVDDRLLADYLAALLRDFGTRRRANQIDDVDDEEHHYVVDLLADLARSRGTRHYKVLVHLGNYTLWLTGLFPDRISARRQRRGGPDIGYYETVGRRGFAEASEHQLAEWTGLGPIFHLTADRFAEVRSALNRVRQDIRLAA